MDGEKHALGLERTVQLAGPNGVGSGPVRVTKGEHQRARGQGGTTTVYLHSGDLENPQKRDAGAKGAAGGDTNNVAAGTGELSPYGTKLVAEAFVWLASLIVWGAGADLSTIGLCNGFCVWQIIAGLASFFFFSFILLMNALCESGRMSRYGWFSHRFEMQLLVLPCILWVPTVAVVSSRGSSANAVSIVFAWFAFGGSCYAVEKAFRSFREEDEPDPIPVGIDENPYIYG
mmetsp:Transcript_10815/g.28964  ORF Transcript_10815/g.28964 Transcript_10815/m.28964 type:complete len:231 (+) Transcript_10815:394-1086(+)